jgi:hypothetical protein
MKCFYSFAGAAIAAAFFTACGGANQSAPITSQVTSARSSSHQLKRDASGCISIQDSTGAKYTAAQTGGGYYSDVEFSSTPCTVGIYINGSNGPNSLAYAAVNGPFDIGIYFDSARRGASVSYASICIHGSTTNYDGCLTGASRGFGTGLYIRNTPRISVAYTEIDSYTAGFATDPCPNKANKIRVDYTTITNAVYPWSYAHGKGSFFFDSPKPKSSCKGSGVGAGSILTPPT